MRYQPTDRPDRTVVGEKWTRYQLRSMQLILQATHGVVSGSSDFFKRAFGETEEQFQEILLRPHHFIFNREWYERLSGRDEFHEYRRSMANLSAGDKVELLEVLSSREPRTFKEIAKSTVNDKIRKIAPFYIPISKAKEEKIWLSQGRSSMKQVEDVPEDERVEDAGLNDDAIEQAAVGSRTASRRQEQLVLL